MTTVSARTKLRYALAIGIIFGGAFGVFLTFFAFSSIKEPQAVMEFRVMRAKAENVEALVEMLLNSEISEDYIFLHVVNPAVFDTVIHESYTGQVVELEGFWEASPQFYVAKRDSDWQVLWFGEPLEVYPASKDFWYQLDTDMHGDLSLLVYATTRTTSTFEFCTKDIVEYDTCP